MTYNGYKIEYGAGFWFVMSDENHVVFTADSVGRCKAWIDRGILGNW